MLRTDLGAPERSHLSRRRLLSGLSGLTLLGMSGAAALAQTSAPPAMSAPNGAPPDDPTAAPAGPEPLRPEFRAVLTQFGTFTQKAPYGEVWVPGVTPQGWHPYPPCHWINTRKVGWYFDDQTPWGQIVHHYGRWARDDQSGWFWVPRSEWSPGWVLWRTNDSYVGWIPLPPDQGDKDALKAAIETADSWLFMETAKFGTTCEPAAALPSAQNPAILQATKFVTRIEAVDGIAVFVLPVGGPVIDIDVIVEPWPVWFFTEIIILWTWIWLHVLIIEIKFVCLPGR